MKKLLIIISAAAITALLATFSITQIVSRTGEAVATAAAQPWPGGMGTLESAADRLGPMQGGNGSSKLSALMKRLPKSDAADAFVLREIARGELTVGQPPDLPDVSTARDLLLREAVIETGAGSLGDTGNEEASANRAIQMTVARLLVGTALAKARVNNREGWEDLHAAWNLARLVDVQPQMMEQTAAFAIVRMINAVAWKMPLPVPPWIAELHARDGVRRLLQAFQYQAARDRERGRLVPTTWLASSIAHDRHIAELLFNTTRCDVQAPSNELGVDLTTVWRRAFRYRAEREATINALRVREGKPIVKLSGCSDGVWSYVGTTLSFSRDIAAVTPDRPMPLTLRVQQDGGEKSTVKHEPH